MKNSSVHSESNAKKAKNGVRYENRIRSIISNALEANNLEELAESQIKDDSALFKQCKVPSSGDDYYPDLDIPIFSEKGILKVVITCGKSLKGTASKGLELNKIDAKIFQCTESELFKKSEKKAKRLNRIMNFADRIYTGNSNNLYNDVNISIPIKPFSSLPEDLKTIS